MDLLWQSLLNVLRRLHAGTARTQRRQARLTSVRVLILSLLRQLQRVAHTTRVPQIPVEVQGLLPIGLRNRCKQLVLPLFHRFKVFSFSLLHLGLELVRPRIRLNLALGLMLSTPLHQVLFCGSSLVKPILVEIVVHN